MSNTLTGVNTLLIRNCPTCGIQYAVPKDFLDAKRRSNGDWYCPNGHSLVFKRTEADELKDKLAAEQSRRAQAEANAEFYKQRNAINIDRAETAERKAIARKGVITRMKKRAAHGVCPCCNRTFKQLAQHMKAKHPEYINEVVE
jgi:uncharacterized Zn finger protein (UPF0148 family)